MNHLPITTLECWEAGAVPMGKGIDTSYEIEVPYNSYDVGIPVWPGPTWGWMEGAALNRSQPRIAKKKKKDSHSTVSEMCKCIVIAAG